MSSGEAQAYNRYNDGCDNCHGGFTGSTSPKGTTFPSNDKHEMHRNSSYMNTACNLCHTSGDGWNPYLGSSNGTGNTPGLGCTGCHGRVEDPNATTVTTATVSGAGLRQHHYRAQVTSCTGCHSDSNPANFTTVDEGVYPPYYGSSDTNVNDPCNLTAASNSNESWSTNDTVGQDNDGDLLYDALDGDCALPAEPDIAASPLSLPFGNVYVGQTGSLSVQIDNIGDADLTVSSLGFTGSADFDLAAAAPATPFVVASGGSATVPVEYSPAGVGGDTGTLAIGSDDPDEGTVNVALSGAGILTPVCDINIQPLTLDFGVSLTTLSTSVGNTGSAACTVTGLSLSGSADFSLGAAAPTPPFAVPPGGSVDVPVDFTASGAGGYSGTLTVGSNDPDEASVGVTLTAAEDAVGDAVTVYRDGAWLLYDFATGGLTESVWTGGGGSCIPAPMDYDGDGVWEFTQICDGSWIFYNDDGSYLKGIATGNASDLPVPADYDGDGTDDVVVFRAGAWLAFDFATGAPTWGVWTGMPAHWTGGTSVAAPMDYDGDGSADFTVYSGGPWHFFNDDGTYNKGLWTGGVAGDIPVAADYNGDGTDDVAVFRAGAWLAFDFGTGASTWGVWTGMPAHWNGGQSLPAPLDCDGDGSVDFTVYSGGPWHFFNGDGTYAKGIWTGGVAGDDPVSRRLLP